MNDEERSDSATESALPPLATPPGNRSVPVTPDELAIARANRFALRPETASALALSFAHEVRNPLTAVVSNLQYALRADAVAHDSRSGLAESLRDSLEAARQIENVVLTLTLLVNGQGRSAQRVHVRPEVLAAFRMAEQHTRLPQTKVALELDPSCVALVAPGEVSQIVTNLLLNSLNAIESSRVGGQVLLGAQVVPDAVEVSVDDDGPGWPSSDADAPQSRGSGLGLIVVRAIVESRHGTMRLEKSKRLGGARVLVRLPSW